MSKSRKAATQNVEGDENELLQSQETTYQTSKILVKRLSNQEQTKTKNVVMKKLSPETDGAITQAQSAEEHVHQPVDSDFVPDLEKFKSKAAGQCDAGVQTDHSQDETQEDEDYEDTFEDSEEEFDNARFRQLLESGALSRILEKHGWRPRQEKRLSTEELSEALTIKQTLNNERRNQGRMEGGLKEFQRQAAKDTYLVNAWPKQPVACAQALALMKELCNIEDRTTCTITSGIVTKYSTLIKSWRTTLHSQVDTWIHKEFKYPMDIFPNVETATDRRQSLSYLAEKSRFARKNYSTSGALLQNKCLLMYRLAKFTDSIMYRDDTDARSFAEDSTYNRIYNDLLDDQSCASQRINWVVVQDMIREEFSDAIEDGRWTTLRAMGEE
ncbi:hypothetical protein BCR43DRAFT_506992 [Syncephalastrum racemosum]|uniref:Uncharacterized protein n=1 Tax=Syncephalastrum racemosum TaxID=13706 RepID=A0A1X2H5G5_SYNRA|nr:hypothetical protein BCR43DRAFT_506992 [Syncephalastrum racemosum]